MKFDFGVVSLKFLSIILMSTELIELQLEKFVSMEVVD
jgi:hypothetical protein